MLSPITLRASSLAELFDCPARWEAKHLRHLRTPTSGAAQLGTALHASTALYDRSRLEHQDLTPDDCAGVIVDVIYKPSEDVQWGEDLAQHEAEHIARAVHARYCERIAPAQDYAAIEVRCESLAVSDLGLVLMGTTDRIRRTEAGCGIADLKSGKTAVGADGTVATGGHALQLGVYELLAQHASGLAITAPAQIVGLQTGKTSKAQRVGTAEVHAARELLLGTPEDPGVLQHASEIIHSGRFYGNSRSMLCHQKFCPIYASCRWRK